MLDTKLKKTCRLKCMIIALIILLPAVILVGLYPQMEKAAVLRKTELQKIYEEENELQKNETYQKEIDMDFIYMSTEAAYYVYAGLLRENMSSVDLSIYQEYDWDDDYYRIRNETKYCGIWNEANESHVSTNADWDMSALKTLSDDNALKLLNEHMLSPAGFLIIEFNKYGELADVHMVTKDSVWSDYDYSSLVLESMQQFQNNADYYESWLDESTDTTQLVPKDFTMILALEDSSTFCLDLYGENWIVYISWAGIYYDIGALWVVLFMAAVVALCALLLPFIKRLETGWERIFKIPLEASIVLILAGISGAYGMFALMSHTTKTLIIENAQSANVAIEIIGISVGPDILYAAMLIFNAIGWAVLFFAEYVVVTNFRQFLCQPVHYFKERIFIVRLAVWLKNTIKGLIHSMIHTSLNGHIRKWFLIIAGIHFLCMFGISIIFIESSLAGILCMLAYAVIIYLLLRKYGGQLQGFYRKLLDSARQMAEGNLKAPMNDDLGVFKDMGDELKAIQNGFSKAVVEEARSQNMKTELITNVSHDLKTPLTAMITYIDLMKQAKLSDEEKASYLSIIDQKSQRLKVLIEDLFEVSKASTGNIQMHRMAIDVVSLMKEVRLEMEEKIAQSDLSFKWNLPEEKLILNLDGQRTFRVFENLLNNAMKYSMPKSRVYVDVINQDTQVCIMFRNISAEEIGGNPNDLTERFVRGDSARKTEGSGLGLAIAKSFVELQQGKFDISVDGDLFKVTILWDKQ